MPKRIQRTRKKGSKLPEGTVCCTRPGEYSNRFRVGMWFSRLRPDWRAWMSGDSPQCGNEQVRDLEHSLELFEDYATCRMKWQPDWLDPILDKPFWACWCRLDSKCHVDVLIRLAAIRLANRQERINR